MNLKSANQILEERGKTAEKEVKAISKLHESLLKSEERFNEMRDSL